jgi:hypothetical protein
VANCEEKLAAQLNLIHAQDHRLLIQEDIAAQHTTDIAKINLRVQSVEKSQPVSQEALLECQRQQERIIQGLQQSVRDLTERLNSRNSYIRAEVKKQMIEYQAPAEQEYSRINTRLDSLRDDLVMHKIRVEDCQRVVDEHETKCKRYETDTNILDMSLKKKIRVERCRIDELSDRMAALEKQLDDEHARGLAKEGANDEICLQLESRLTRFTQSITDVRLAKLIKRIAALEEARGSAKENGVSAAIGKIRQRLNALETDQGELKKNARKDREASDKKMDDLKARLTRQERAIDFANANNASHRAGLRRSSRGPAGRTYP